MFPEYEARNELLKSLGFPSYGAYLASKLWHRIRAKVLKRTRHRCEICRTAAATQVHHTAYTREVLLGEKLTKVIAICDECHTLGERGWEFEKTRMSQCGSRLKKLSKAQSERKKATRDICFVCRTKPSTRWFGKCKDCQRNQPRFD